MQFQEGAAASTGDVPVTKPIEPYIDTQSEQSEVAFKKVIRRIPGRRSLSTDAAAMSEDENQWQHIDGMSNGDGLSSGTAEADPDQAISQLQVEGRKPGTDNEVSPVDGQGDCSTQVQPTGAGEHHLRSRSLNQLGRAVKEDDSESLVDGLYGMRSLDAVIQQSVPQNAVASRFYEMFDD